MTLSVDNLTKSYLSRPAVHGVSFEARSGAVTGVIGPNGAGKSTVMKAVIGLLRPDSGTITIDGEPVARNRAAVAYMAQRAALDWDYPAQVRDVVEMGRYPHRRWGRRRTKQDRDAVAAALQRVGLSELANRQIGELSGGQQQRMLLARALAQKASTLLLDEPFVGVDVATVALLTDLLVELAREGTCVVLVNHDLATTSKICDHVVLLNQRVIAQGPTSVVLTTDWLDQTYAADLLDDVDLLDRKAQ